MTTIQNQSSASRPPRDNLVRAIDHSSYELRAAENGTPPTLVGHFAVFDQWTEIDSIFEGHFMERIAPGSFAKTFNESGANMKVTLNHGRDPELGDKPLGVPEKLEEDSVGAAYEVPLFDGIPPLVMSGLRAGAYGSSFRFRVTREEFDQEPERSDHNPDGLPERTIKEVDVMEFGPVTFPAYVGATAGVRSLTDEFLFEHISQGEGLHKFAEYVRQEPEPPKSSAKPTPAPTTSARAKETTQAKEVKVSVDIDKFDTIPALQERLDEVKRRQAQIVEEYGTRALPTDVQSEWDELKEEKPALAERIAEVEARHAEIAENAKVEQRTIGGSSTMERRVQQPAKSRVPDNPFDYNAYRQASYSEEDERQLKRSGALQILQASVFPHEAVKREDAQTDVERMINKDHSGELAERLILTGSATYARALGKWAQGRMLTTEEQGVLERAAFTLGTTGMPLVFQLDPTVIRTSNYVINPIRRISRVETISGTNEWRGLTSGAVVATYEAEATEAADQTPTLTQPAVKVQRAQTFVPYSREVDQDWSQVQSEMAGLFQEAKDILEATQFYSGAGTTVFPQGVRTGLTNTQRVQTATTAVFVVGDLYALQNALPPRARNAGSSFIASLTQLNRIRALDTSGGSSLWVQLGSGLPGQLLGMSAYELSTMPTAITTTTDLMIVGDFKTGYLIVDRIGMELELIPHLFGASNRFPTGQRGLWAMWRNSAIVLDANRFRFLQVL